MVAAALKVDPASAEFVQDPLGDLEERLTAALATAQTGEYEAALTPLLAIAHELDGSAYLTLRSRADVAAAACYIELGWPTEACRLLEDALSNRIHALSD